MAAKPFFLNQGYRIVTELQVIRHGTTLTNYVMVKRLEHNQH